MVDGSASMIGAVIGGALHEVNVYKSDSIMSRLKGF